MERYKLGLPCMKLNTVNRRSSHCGNFRLVAMEALDERKTIDPDVNPELTSNNIYLTDITSGKQLLEYAENLCRTLHDASGRKIRADAVKMIVTIIKPSEGMMRPMAPERQLAFLDDAYEIFSSLVGTSNIIAAVHHVDEQIYHTHIFWLPMTIDNRLCAKEVLNLSFYSRLNKIMPMKLREKGWPIKDCDAYDANEINAKIAARIEQYKLENPDLNYDAKTIAELTSKFKEEIYQERHKTFGRSSAQYKSDITAEVNALLKQKEQLEQDIAFKKQSIMSFDELRKSIKKNRRLQTMFESISSLTEGTVTLNDIPYNIAQSFIHGIYTSDTLDAREKDIYQREASISQRERLIQTKEDTLSKQIDTGINTLLPLEMQRLKQIEKNIKKEKKELSQRKKELDKTEKQLKDMSLALNEERNAFEQEKKSFWEVVKAEINKIKEELTLKAKKLLAKIKPDYVDKQYSRAIRHIGKKHGIMNLEEEINSEYEYLHAKSFMKALDDIDTDDR